MAIEIKFIDETCKVKSELTVKKAEITNEHLVIEIKYEHDDYFSSRIIFLDKPTSIKLAKELRKQISFLEEVNNG